MSGIPGVCVIGVVDKYFHTAVETASLITVSRGYDVEARPMLTPPDSIWLYFYDADGKRILDADGNVIRIMREE